MKLGSERSKKGKKGKRKEKAGVPLVRVSLPKERRQVSPTAIEKVATPGKPPTDTQRIGWDLVAAHRAIPLLCKF